MTIGTRLVRWAILPLMTLVLLATDDDCATAGLLRAPGCCPAPCVRYVYRGCAKACYGCEAPVQTMLRVVNPATCCAVDIPVCLPACCQGCPAVSARCGLLGRAVVHHDWCCGFSVTVRFNRRGDAVVVYRGA